jgi:hypothetical protein
MTESFLVGKKRLFFSFDAIFKVNHFSRQPAIVLLQVSAPAVNLLLIPDQMLCYVGVVWVTLTAITLGYYQQ